MAQNEWEELAPLPRAMKITGLAESTIYRDMKAGTFPKPIKVGRKALWPVSRLHEWVRKAIEKSEGSASNDDVGTE
uniref:helix-turn-helix transcriptional regulator n=1 Tax=Xanthomonas albilineans TaxID=29447 RepID=UPI0027DCCF26|nr:AlpA family phage regulatory protein [Xanthomonas albilineans]